MKTKSLVLLLCALSFAAHAQQPVWSVERGWLVARSGDAVWLAPQDGPAANVTIDDTPLLPDESALPVTKPLERGGFATTYATKRGALVDRVEPFATLGADAWLRSLEYTNTSSSTQDLTGADLRVAPAVMAEGAVWNPQWFWMGEVAAGRAVCVSYRGSTDYYRIDVDARGRPSHHVDACWRLAPGQKATITAQGIWLGAAGKEPFRAEAQRWYDAIGLRVPSDTPDWVYSMVLYECCAGGHIDTRFSDVGGFDHLAHQVENLAGLGFTAVWLQSVHEHKTPPDPMTGGWNPYDPLDFSKVDSILGGPEALKRLTDAFHKRGIHVLGEIVPHGGHSVQAMALEPWWTYQRDGTAARNWGGCAMDYSSPAWQGVMRDAVAMLSRDFGMEGVRIDCADGSGPNWKSPRTNQASFSTLAGSIEMLTAIRDGLVQGSEDRVGRWATALHESSSNGNTDRTIETLGALRDGALNGRGIPALIPENINTVEHFALTPIAYGHSTAALFAKELPPIKDDPALMVKKLRDFFENERGSYPAGARVIRTLGNHDTVCEAGRAMYRYGAGLSRALYGVCLMVEGIPMMYQEEEIGSQAEIAMMNGQRLRLSELSLGTADYEGVAFAPEVFSCLRSFQGHHTVGLANLSGKTIRGRVQLPEALSVPDNTRAYDSIRVESAETREGGFDTELGPYETAFWAIDHCDVLAFNGLRGGAIFPSEEPAVSKQPSPEKIDVGDGFFKWFAGGIRAELHAGPDTWRSEGLDGKVMRYRSEYGEASIAYADDAFDVNLHLGKEANAYAPELVIFNASRWVISGQTAKLQGWTLRRHFPFPPGVSYAWSPAMPWVGVPLYSGVAPTDRVWQSLLEPLNIEYPVIVFSNNWPAEVHLSSIESNARNIVLSDRTGDRADACGLALRFYGVDPELNRRIAAFGLGQPWSLDTYLPAEPQEQRIRFRISRQFQNICRLNYESRSAIDRGEARVTCDGEAIRREASGIWFVKPGTVTWSKLVPVKGKYRIRFELRHSESSPTGTDLDNAYEIRIDGEAVPLEWVKRNVYQTGNAYFGYAMTPALDLDQRGRTVAITTKQPWCAQRGDFHLTPADVH